MSREVHSSAPTLEANRADYSDVDIRAGEGVEGVNDSCSHREFWLSEQLFWKAQDLLDCLKKEKGKGMARSVQASPFHP